MRTALRLVIPVGALCVGILAGTPAAYAEPTTAQLEQQITEKSTELEKHWNSAPLKPRNESPIWPTTPTRAPA
jgi:hypothetical protein